VTEQPQPEEVPAALDLSVKDVKTPQPPQLIPAAQQQPPPRRPPPLHTHRPAIGRSTAALRPAARHRASAARRAAKLSSPPMKSRGQGLDTQPLSSANSPQQWGDEAELCSINRMDQENLEKDSLSLNLNDHPMNSDSGEATDISSRCGAAGRAVAGRAAAASSGAFRDGAGAAAAVAAAAALRREIAAKEHNRHCGALGAAAAARRAAVSGSDRVAADAAQPAGRRRLKPRGAVGGVDDGVGDRVAVPAGSRAAWAVPVVRVCHGNATGPPCPGSPPARLRDPCIRMLCNMKSRSPLPSELPFHT
uniref:Pecanex-like protein n=1 Tax=Macrostomum lignano TaxID=282301 RepID=A0A1I8FEM0_9PLAT